MKESSWQQQKLIQYPNNKSHKSTPNRILPKVDLKNLVRTFKKNHQLVLNKATDNDSP